MDIYIEYYKIGGQGRNVQGRAAARRNKRRKRALPLPCFGLAGWHVLLLASGEGKGVGAAARGVCFEKSKRGELDLREEGAEEEGGEERAELLLSVRRCHHIRHLDRLTVPLLTQQEMLMQQDGLREASAKEEEELR